MKRSMQITLIGAIIMSLSACSVGNPSSSGTSSGTVASELPVYRIGVIAPLTGAAAAYGEQEKRILDFEAEQINKESEKNGYIIKLSYEDGKCDGAAASAAFQKFTDVDGIKVILWGLCSSESLAMASLLDSKKEALLLSPTSSSPDIEWKHPRLFSLSYNDNVTGEEAAKELWKFQKVAIISEQNDYNQWLYNVITKVLQRDFSESQIIMNEWFPKGSTDFRNQLEKIKNSGVEAVFLNSNIGVTSEALARQIAEMHDWKPQFISHIGFTSSELLTNLTQVVEGMVIFDAPSINSPEFKKYQDQIIASKGSLKDIGAYYTASSLDALHILADLMKKYSENTEQMRNALATQVFHGWLGDIRFDGHSFVQGIASARFVVHSGKMEPSAQ